MQIPGRILASIVAAIVLTALSPKLSKAAALNLACALEAVGGDGAQHSGSATFDFDFDDGTVVQTMEDEQGFKKTTTYHYRSQDPQRIVLKRDSRGSMYIDRTTGEFFVSSGAARVYGHCAPYTPEEPKF